MDYLKTFRRLLLASLLITAYACDEYLSTLPDNRTTIDSKKKVIGLLINAYPESNYQELGEVMSDNADDKETSRNVELEKNLYQWKDVIGDGRDTPTHYWVNCYEAIAQANQALASIEELGGGKEFDPQKGEALLCRAYAHFMLVNFFAKHYDPKTAGSDLGIPYVLKPENTLIVQYKRGTVKGVYEQLEKDITEGVRLVGNDYEQPKFHFTKAAANAFAARFFLYKGDWDKVIAHASKCFAGDPKEEIRDMIAMEGLSYAAQSRRYANSVGEPTNLLLVSTSSLWDRTYAGIRFGLSQNKLTEMRGIIKNPLPGRRWIYDYNLYGRATSYNFPKYEEYFRFTNRSAGTGFPFVGIVLFDKDEALLNRAEAYVMKKDYDKAIKDLDDYLTKKTRNHAASDKLTLAMINSNYDYTSDEFTPHYPIDLQQGKLIKAINGFKRWEFYHEGMRWFDIRRFKIKVTHKFLDSKDLVLEKDDLRRQLQIPRNATARGIKPNPR